MCTHALACFYKAKNNNCKVMKADLSKHAEDDNARTAWVEANGKHY
jgi:hypothetical protein